MAQAPPPVNPIVRAHYCPDAGRTKEGRTECLKQLVTAYNRGKSLTTPPGRGLALKAGTIVPSERDNPASRPGAIKWETARTIRARDTGKFEKKTGEFKGVNLAAPPTDAPPAGASRAAPGAGRALLVLVSVLGLVGGTIALVSALEARGS